MSVGGPAAILSARTPFALSTNAMLGGIVRWTFALFVLFQVVVRIPLVACELRIIDDLHGDLGNSSNQVQFTGNWISSQSGGDCPFCYGHQLDDSQVVQGSWHWDANPKVLMNISFVGTSISVYYILPQFGVPISTSFTLDGVPQNELFTHNPTNDSNNPFIYNATAFHTDGLENLQHHLVVSINAGSAILFDYATYDHVDSDDTTAPPPSASGLSSVPSPTSAMKSASGTSTPDNVSITSHAAGSIDTSTPLPGLTSTSSPITTFTASSSAGTASTTSLKSGMSSTAPVASNGQSLASVSSLAAPASFSAGGTTGGTTTVSASATAKASSSSSSRTSKIGMIVGAASGGCVVIMIALLSFCIWSRRRRRAGQNALRKADAFAFVHKNESASAANDDILGSLEMIAASTRRDQMNPKQMAAERRTFFARSRDTHAHTASSAGSGLPLVGTRINILQAETDRLRAQYAAGPPPTYVSEPGLD